MCAYHLPALRNPLLNVLFNNPLLASMAALVQDVQLHSDITVLVPPAEALSDDGITEDFIRSHIIRNSLGLSLASAARKSNPYVYTTLSGKQLLVKNGHVFSGKGFRDSRKVQILAFDGIAAWADYLPRGLIYGCIYISGPLCGEAAEVFKAPLFLATHVASDSIRGSGPGSSSSSLAEPANPASLEPSTGGRSAAPLTPPEPTFSELLQNFPALSRTMAPAFYTLFHHNNRTFQNLRSRKSLPLAQLKKLFAAMVAEAFRIVQDAVNSDSIDGDRTHNLLKSVSMKNPSLDMNRLIHEFVEFNIYDRLWSLLVFQFANPCPAPASASASTNLVPESAETAAGQNSGLEKVPRVILTPQLYHDLLCLSLNQLDIPVDEPWDLNVLYRRIEKAIQVFSELLGSRITNQREKFDILTRTVQVLTKSGSLDGLNLIVDADTLIGLLIMVIVHSKVPNLECHLYYIQNFGLGSASGLHAAAEPGYLTYILLNFNAVVYHLQGPITKEVNASSENYSFWAAIRNADHARVEQILLQIDQPHQSLPRSDFLTSKNIHGESFWFIAIRANDAAIFELLLEKTLSAICIEDLVFDTNTSTSQNLLMVALQHENPSIIHALMDVLESNLSDAELSAYVNFPDHRGRTVGHYLSHDLAALQRFGRLVDWSHKDHNSQTPLFSFCRAYDHPSYTQLIAEGFRLCNVAYNVHTDRSGNTLLHAMSRGIPQSGLWEGQLGLLGGSGGVATGGNFCAAVDVNEHNARGLSPASLSMRYNRLENLQVLLSAKSFIFGLEDPKTFHNLLDSYSYSAAKKHRAGACEPEFRQIELLVISGFFDCYFPQKSNFMFGVISGKYDVGQRDWLIHTVCRTHGLSMHLPLESLKKIIQLFRMSNSPQFMPLERFWANFPESKSNDPINAKYKLNRLIDHVNLFFLSLAFTDASTQACLREIVQRSKDELVFEMTKGAAKAKPLPAHLDVQKVQEMTYFVEFSKNNLVRSRHVTRRLSNLASCGGIKHDDLRGAQDVVLRALGTRLCSAPGISPWSTFHSFLAWLEACTEQLILQCDLLFGKIHLWESLYRKITDMNKELAELEAVVLKRLATAERALHNRGTFAVDDIPADEHFKEESDFTLIFGLGDLKKLKYKRLVSLKAESVTKISDLSANLRGTHETIAAEISLFLLYRLNMLAFGLMRFTKASVLSLRHTTVQLEKCLEGLRIARLQEAGGACPRTAQPSS